MCIKCNLQCLFLFLFCTVLFEVDVYGSPAVATKVSEAYVSKGTRGRVEVEFCADPLPKQVNHGML